MLRTLLVALALAMPIEATLFFGDSACACRTTPIDMSGFDVSSLANDSGHYYSYAACGELDTFSTTMAVEPLRGALLQIGVQNNSGGWQGSYNAFGTHARQGEWTGPLWKFFKATAEYEGFYYNITDAPDLVKQKSGSGSSFWHCTHGTATGHYDLCIGLHTVTPERFRQTDWFIVQLNVLHLVVPQKEGLTWDKLYDALATVFTPMEPLLWFIVFFVAMPFATFVVAYQERRERLKPMDWVEHENIRVYQTRGGRTRAAGRTRTRQRDSEAQARMEAEAKLAEEAGFTFPTLSEHFFMEYFVSLRSLIDGGLGYSRSVGARVTQLGLGLFIVLFLTAYTASFTTFLVNREKYGTISSLQEAMSMNKKICGTEMGSTSARAAYPYDGWVVDPRCDVDAGKHTDILNSLGWTSEAKFCLRDLDGVRVPGIKNQADVLPLLDTGYCDVAVIDQEDLRREHMKGKFCNMMKVGEAVAYETVGMPLTTVGSRANQLQNAFASAIYRGEWERQKTLGRSTDGYSDPPLCSVMEEMGVDGAYGAQLKVDDMLGAILVLLLFILVGLFFSWFADKAVEVVRKSKMNPDSVRI